MELTCDPGFTRDRQSMRPSRRQPTPNSGLPEISSQGSRSASDCASPDALGRLDGRVTTSACGAIFAGLERRRAMPAPDEDDRPKKKITHEIGQDLTLLSVKELQERIALLKEEIGR